MCFMLLACRQIDSEVIHAVLVSGNCKFVYVNDSYIHADVGLISVYGKSDVIQGSELWSVKF